ncbi:MAG: hypothetical protein AAB776_00915 [Patescibacteria group bacterium]
MRHILSIPVTATQAKDIKMRAKKRGYGNVSAYVRELILEDKLEPISESELTQLSKEADRAYAKGLFVTAKSLADLVE